MRALCFVIRDAGLTCRLFARANRFFFQELDARLGFFVLSRYALNFLLCTLSNEARIRLNAL